MIEDFFNNDIKRILLWILLNTCLFHIVSAEKMKSCWKCSAKVTEEDRHVTDLTLYEHGHVHEHVVQLLDGGLQLDDVGVPSLDVRQGLLGRRRVHDDALGTMYFSHLFWYTKVKSSCSAIGSHYSTITAGSPSKAFAIKCAPHQLTLWYSQSLEHFIDPTPTARG